MADKLTPAQTAAVEHRGGALLIAAAAGSGKTQVLVERLMSRISAQDGPDIDDFLVITFTRAAAAELRERIAFELTKKLSADPSSRRLRRQLALVSRAHISTIDAFCAEIVRANAHLLDIRPDFRIADEHESALMRSRVLEELLEARYSAITPGFAALADAMGAGRKNDSQLVDTVLETHGALQAHAYPRRWIEARLSEPTDYSDIGESVWGAELLGRASHRTEQLIGLAREAREGLFMIEAADKAYGERFDEAIESFEAFLAALGEGWDAASHFGAPQMKGLKALKKEYQNEPEVIFARKVWEMMKDGRTLAKYFDADSSVHLNEMVRSRVVTDELFRLILDFDDELTEEKKRRGVLDYGDLEHLSVRLLVDENGAPTPRARDIAAGFAEILVDEYQDVSGVQDMIFSAVSQEKKNLVLVGDVKQSIYRFRLADPTIFLKKYNEWEDAPAPGMPRRLLLSANFRSRTTILDAVNDLFSRIMTPELGEMEYGENEALRGGGTFPDSDEPPFELLLLDRPQLPEDADKDAAEATLTAQRIRALLDSGMTVQGRPLAPGDIAVLLRSVSSHGEEFAAALRREGIAASAQKNGPTEDAGVSAVLAFLSVIDNPHQDVALIAVLRSMLFGFTTDELAAIRASEKNTDFYSALTVRAQTDAKCADFLAFLSRCRDAAPELGLERLLLMIYDETGVTAATDSGGFCALLDAVRAFEARGGAGLYGFVTELREMEEAGKPFSLPPAKTAGGEVTVCSIHASKGLGWPVVVVAGLSNKFNLEDEKKTFLIHRDLGIGPYFVDTERGIKYPTFAREAIKGKIRNETLSEEMRLLYVAMTRAKEKLILVTNPSKGAETWAELSAAASEPVPAELEKCVSMGQWVLLTAALLSEHDPKWRPVIAVPHESGEQKTESAERREADAGLADEISRRIAFAPPAGEAWRIPSKITATELKGSAKSAEAAEDADTYVRTEAANLRRPVFETERTRLTPTERGTALHKAVQFSDLALCVSEEGARGEIERLRERHLLTPAEADSVHPADLTALAASPLGNRMLASPGLRREFKFSLLIPAGELLDGAGEDELLLQGVVDCLFDDGDGLVIVDFKSDNVTRLSQSAAVKQYAPQLGAYAKAMERIFGRPVREKILYFFRTREAVNIDTEERT